MNFDAITLIKNHLIDYPLLGRGGLKDRSTLMEYKYDNH
ncbi:ABC-three component system middle component 5 [Gilliamella apicola]